VAALDDWGWGYWVPHDLVGLGTFAKRNPTNPPPKKPPLRALETAEQAHFRAILNLADPDEWRTRLRDPGIRRDRRALEEMADPEKVATLPPATAVLLWRDRKHHWASCFLAHFARRFRTRL
jgi:hypothetical protein